MEDKYEYALFCNGGTPIESFTTLGRLMDFMLRGMNGVLFCNRIHVYTIKRRLKPSPTPQWEDFDLKEKNNEK